MSTLTGVPRALPQHLRNQLFAIMVITVFLGLSMTMFILTEKAYNLRLRWNGGSLDLTPSAVPAIPPVAPPPAPGPAPAPPSPASASVPEKDDHPPVAPLKPEKREESAPPACAQDLPGDLIGVNQSHVQLSEGKRRSDAVCSHYRYSVPDGVGTAPERAGASED